MPPKKEQQKQKQKQKQTVIVNIGDKVIKRRKRKPRKRLSAPPPPPPSPFPPQDFARVIFQPQPPLRPDENLAVQLNSVTKQLNDLKEQQKNRTANVMAGQKAAEREAQQLGEPEPDDEPVLIRRKKRTEPVVQPVFQPVSEPIAQPKIERASSAPETLTKSRKQRSDKGEPRGQLFSTVARQTLAQGGRLATILPTPPASEQKELGEQGSGAEEMTFA